MSARLWVCAAWGTLAFAGACGRVAESPSEATGGVAAGGGGVASAGRGEGGAASGETSAGGTSAGGAAMGGGSSSGGVAQSCVVAQRLDTCCAIELAVQVDELRSELCLVPLFEAVPSTVASACLERRGDCSQVKCGGSPQRSRLAAPDAQGVCQFVDECKSASDCVAARDTSRCCSSYRGFPRALALTAECVVENDAEPACADCSTVDCSCCAELEKAPTCLAGAGGFKVCGPASNESRAPECSVELACGDRFECIPPGKYLCGGPAPPPDECDVDRDCPSSVPATICDRRFPCYAKQCIAGCASDSACESGEACGQNGRCHARVCSTDEACGPNHRCEGGVCTRVRCERSRDCAGYCVGGSCYDQPGTCQDPTLP